MEVKDLHDVQLAQRSAISYELEEVSRISDINLWLVLSFSIPSEFPDSLENSDFL